MGTMFYRFFIRHSPYFIFNNVKDSMGIRYLIFNISLIKHKSNLNLNYKVDTNGILKLEKMNIHQEEEQICT